MPPFKQILVPTDFSDDSVRAMEYSIDVARQNQAKLSVIHVMDNYYQHNMEYGGGPGLELAKQLRVEMLETLETELGAFIQRFALEGLSCQYKLLEGNPSTEIIEYVAENSFDLVVIGSHGKRKGLWQLGSVAEKVVHHSRSCVLVIKPEVISS
ncbi:MAG: universal stress protein [SAR324 cluster bacterium]|nr:universal stress protein [SAR324 cluster bacterium]